MDSTFDENMQNGFKNGFNFRIKVYLFLNVMYICPD